MPEFAVRFQWRVQVREEPDHSFGIVNAELGATMTVIRPVRSLFIFEAAARRRLRCTWNLRVTPTLSNRRSRDGAGTD